VRLLLIFTESHTDVSQANEFISSIRISPSNNQFICLEKLAVHDQCRINPTDHQEGFIIGEEGPNGGQLLLLILLLCFLFNVPRSVYLRSLGNAEKRRVPLNRLNGFLGTS